MNEWFEAEQRVERAQQLAESHRWDEALTEINAAIAINPHNAIWHAHRGYILEELDQWDEAAGAYESSLEIEPDDREVAVALAVALRHLGRYARALEILDSLAKKYADFEPAYCQRISIYAELGRHDQAEEMFYLAQELNDSCPDCFYAMGSSLWAREQTERAIYCWRRVLELDPQYAGVNQRIAQAYRAQGEREKAREYYLRELREDPGDTDLLFEIAGLAMESGDLVAAATKLHQILELDPKHLDSHYALGRIWLSRGQAAQAVHCFETVQKLAPGDPGLPEFDFHYGTALGQLGRNVEAIEKLRTAAAKEASPRVWMQLGDCLLSSGKAGEAADTFRRVLAQSAENHVAHHRLALCVLREGHAASALEHCREALRLKPAYTGALVTSVVANLTLARWREARLLLRDALGQSPNHVDLLRLRDRLWRIRLRYYWRVLKRFLGRPLV